MSKQIITALPTEERRPLDHPSLNVSEFFYDTIQGEGINIGHPAAFLRLQGCTLNCSWCDTDEVWRVGNPYGITELVQMIVDSGLGEKLASQHLVITGGSPLHQQFDLVCFLEQLRTRLGFLPYVEIENECVLKPSKYLIPLIGCWNNSPKLDNSGNSKLARYKPEVIKFTAGLANSWFKFVITCDCEWDEIQTNYLDTGLIDKKQIILMPQGQTRLELGQSIHQTVEMAIKHGVRYSTREHIILYDRKTGV